ncbi:hypothetical protein [Croceicoccus sp. YJ47]|uniref:hypothetical protein n=1 Tax=Croceicoccus sp. YJ47 TaxID=2798724 RepID=UPI0019240DAE|nr:hypothetical protein [Croceicoccus sp. YJ47]QQN73893.1 hypothetical protein JD971_14260 [Croceicoccus sp. YJ47]
MRIKLETISDFARRGYRIRISCRCGHVVVHEPLALLRALPRNMSPRIEAIEDRLKCSNCGARGGAISPAE